MQPLALHDLHKTFGAAFTELNGFEAVADFGDMLAEHRALQDAAGVVDFSFRSRICLTGADRVRFLHGQVTNDVKALKTGEGCYAALVTAKGRMESDLNIFVLKEELLLDFEPGLTPAVIQRLEKYIVADDVQVVDVAPHYGLLTVQGPASEQVVSRLGLFRELPEKPFTFRSVADQEAGEIYLMNQPRLGTTGFDLYAPAGTVRELAGKLITAAKEAGGGRCGWSAFDSNRILAGIPRFGVDMDGSCFPQECGIESRAMSYSKGCYIGQEVLNRLHTMGHVNRELRRLAFPDGLAKPPSKEDKLFQRGKEVGHVTSVSQSSAPGLLPGLGFVRREAIEDGGEVLCRSAGSEFPVRLLDAVAIANPPQQGKG